MKKEHISSRSSKSQMKFPFLFHPNTHTQIAFAKSKNQMLVFDCFSLFLIAFFFASQTSFFAVACCHYTFASHSGAYGHVVFDVSETDAILIFFIFSSLPTRKVPMFSVAGKISKDVSRCAEGKSFGFDVWTSKIG